MKTLSNLPRMLAAFLSVFGAYRLGSAATGSNGVRKPVLLRRASQALTPHASVHLVHWNGEELLLGCTAQQVSVLARKSVDGTGEAA